MASTTKMIVWEDLRNELRKLRGNNLFRGVETHLWHQNQIRIPYEMRADRSKSGEIIIHVGDSMEQSWAERLPSSERIEIESFENNWKKWLRALVDECRGGEYLHTNSKTADYRRKIATANENIEGNRNV